MLKLDTRAELDALYTWQIQESLTLECKSSGAVDKAQSKKEEIAKDASALANAAGGQIAYGMTEQNNLPAGLDAGLDHRSSRNLVRTGNPAERHAANRRAACAGGAAR